MLKPQDALTACKVFSLGDEPWSYRRLAASLSLSLAETHDSVGRCLDSGLLVRGRRDREKIQVAKRRLYDLCAVALPTFCYPVRGKATLGVPTSVHAGCLANLFPPSEASVLVVWPCEEGEVVRGESLLPVYPSVPQVARRDALLHKLLALVDVVRVGSPVERRSAMEMLKEAIVGDGRRCP